MELRSRSLFFILVISFSTRPALGQTSSNGAIRGHVHDATGAVLPKTTVTAVSSTVPTPFTVVSDADGYYRLIELPPGQYDLTAELTGFAKYVRRGVVVRAGLNLGVDVDMVLGGRTETTTVTAETPMLESSSAVQAVNIDGEFQRHLPLTSRRDWSDSLSLAPGVVTTPNATGKLFYYLHGADSSSLVMQVDGADLASTLQNTNTYINLSTEAIQDVQIKTGAVDASTPIGVGAVLSVVTQSGTNSLKGAAGIAYQDESWNGNNTPGGTSAAFEIAQPDASLGGPILKNRAWFFGAYRYTSNSLGVSRTATQLANLRALVPGFQPLGMDSEASYYFGKVTAQITPSHRVEGFWQRDHSPEHFVGPNSGGRFFDRDFGGIGSSLRLASVWSRSLTTRVNVSFNNKGIGAVLARDDLPSRNVHQNVFLSGGRLIGTGTLVVLDNVPSVTDQPADKVTVSADATWYRHSSAGSHELQAGMYLQPRIRDRTTLHYVNGGYALEEVVLRDPSNPAAGVIPFHRQVYDLSNVPSRWADSHDYAVYAQDAWRPRSRLTVNAGVRVDSIDRNDAAFDVETMTSTEIGPRFGVNYLLTKDGRSAIRGSWVRVADVLAQTTQSAGTNASGFRDLYDNDLDGTFETSFVTPGVSALSTDRVLDDARHQPYMDEWIAGFRQQLRGQLTVDVSVVHREFRERTALVETNGIYEDGVFKGYRNESFNDIYKITTNVWNWPVYTFFELQATKHVDRLQAIRYKLEGKDRDWQDVGTRRQAFYNDLAPRTYRFRVSASNNSGVWNEAGTFLDFSVAPAYYQTTWFRWSAVAAVLALLGALYQLRVREVARQFDIRLEERVNERTRIARELHDTLLQSFHGLLFRFQAATNLLPDRPAEAKQQFESAIDQAAQAITEGRDAVQNLRSSTTDANDLAVAIITLGEELMAAQVTDADTSPTVVEVALEGTPRNLHPILRDDVYRIAGEALRNAFRHARARRIEVEIRYDDRQFRLRVRDDGKGIDPTLLTEPRAGHFGLPGMRERAELIGGRLDVWSEVGLGTELDLKIPAVAAYAKPRERGRFFGNRTSSDS